MYPVLKIMHMLNFLDTFSIGVTVNAKPSKAKVVDKDVKEADDDKHCELVKKILRAWRDVVNSPTEDSFANCMVDIQR